MPSIATKYTEHKMFNFASLAGGKEREEKGGQEFHKQTNENGENLLKKIDQEKKTMSVDQKDYNSNNYTRYSI